MKTGRLKSYTDETTGKPYLLEEEAEVDFFRNADPDRLKTAAENKLRAAQANGEEERPEPANDEAAPGVPTLTVSKARKEKYLAETARLNFEERVGELVKASEVKDGAFKIARTLRNNIMALPDRMAAELAAETNQFKVHRLLTDELRRAIADVIKEITPEEERGPE